jgi:predicted flap endonuclease-1-like 5' DNA nuclease
MGLLLQIVVFLITAAALGFAVGWLVRSGRLAAEQTRVEPDRQARLGSVTAERDRLRAGADATAASRPITADQAQLAARIAELERELATAHEANARHGAEVGRLEARIAELEAAPAAPEGPARTPLGAGQGASGAAAAAPPGLDRPEGEPDDLQQISGIGPGIETTLHRLGIFHFRQIAAFTPENVAWVNQRLRFRGRIEREDWIGQAKRLAAGGQSLQ